MNNLSAHISQICRFLFRENSFRIDTSGLLLWQYMKLLLPRLSKILERKYCNSNRFHGESIQIENKLLFAACALPVSPSSDGII